MQCPDCKKIIPDYSRFCLYCGVRLVLDRNQAPLSQRKRPSSWWEEELPDMLEAFDGDPYNTQGTEVES